MNITSIMIEPWLPLAPIESLFIYMILVEHLMRHHIKTAEGTSSNRDRLAALHGTAYKVLARNRLGPGTLRVRHLRRKPKKLRLKEAF